MWTLDAINRDSEKREIEDYATFDTYAEARRFADKHEMEVRQLGWTWVVRFVG